MEEQPNNQIQFLLSDFNTRLRDLEGRNKLIKDRTLLLGKNLIAIRDQSEEEMLELKKQTNKIQNDLEVIKKLTKSILTETGKFVRRSQVLVIERMLKDFQPLKFTREKDVKELIAQAIHNKTTKTIKTKKSKK